jgi:O-acetylhomoserine/O-acetylserine sulfhydrylase-like pyridoxal-dependent enzyme
MPSPRASKRLRRDAVVRTGALRGDDPHAAVRAFVDGLRCFTLAESLGGVESLIAHPATMTHAAMTAEARARPASAKACCACRSASRPSVTCWPISAPRCSAPKR